MSKNSSDRTEWVKCPICGDTDMAKTFDPAPEGEEGYIHCTNLACASNGGTNCSALQVIQEKDAIIGKQLRLLCAADNEIRSHYIDWARLSPGSPDHEPGYRPSFPGVVYQIMEAVRFGAAGTRRRGRPVIYLANNCGFSALQKEGLNSIEFALSELGFEVWEPFRRAGQVKDVTGDDPSWPYEIAQKDVQDVRDADAVFAVVNGCPPDEGVCIELGLAMALGKPYFLFRDDFRKSSDSPMYPLNLMLFAGLPLHEWKYYFYTSVKEIFDPNRPLARLVADWNALEPAQR